MCWAVKLMEVDEALVHVHGSRPSFIEGPFLVINNLSRYRNVLKHFISRDLKVNYHGTVLGYAWSLLEPLAFTAIFYVVFVILRGAPDPQLPLKIMIGILMYNCFSRTFSQTTQGLTRNAGLIRQVYLPREIFIVSTSGFQLVQLCMSMLIIIPLMWAWSITPTEYLLFLIPAMLGVSAIGTGLGFMLAPLQAKIRDVEQIVAILNRAGFFLSGVFYSIEYIPDEYIPIYTLNPVAVFLEFARVAIYGDFGKLTMHHLWYSVGVAFIFMTIGMMFFKRFEQRAVKYL